MLDIDHAQRVTNRLNHLFAEITELPEPDRRGSVAAREITDLLETQESMSAKATAELPKTFTGTETFEAMRAAERWARAFGWVIAPNQAGSPRGISFGDFLSIAKWRNLTVAERAECDAYMIGNGRHGPITITTEQPR